MNAARPVAIAAASALWPAQDRAHRPQTAFLALEGLYSGRLGSDE
jgi:hypothetical protein